jgi:hypothetical protein
VGAPAPVVAAGGTVGVIASAVDTGAVAVLATVASTGAVAVTGLCWDVVTGAMDVGMIVAVGEIGAVATGVAVVVVMVPAA